MSISAAVPTESRPSIERKGSGAREARQGMEDRFTLAAKYLGMKETDLLVQLEQDKVANGDDNFSNQTIGTDSKKITFIYSPAHGWGPNCNQLWDAGVLNRPVPCGTAVQSPATKTLQSGDLIASILKDGDLTRYAESIESSNPVTVEWSNVRHSTSRTGDARVVTDTQYPYILVDMKRFFIDENAVTVTKA